MQRQFQDMTRSGVQIAARAWQDGTGWHFTLTGVSGTSFDTCEKAWRLARRAGAGVRAEDAADTFDAWMHLLFTKQRHRARRDADHENAVVIADFLLASELAIDQILATPPADATSHAEPKVGHLSAGEIAERSGLGRSAVESRLRRWRKANAASGGWIEHDTPKANEPQYLYAWDAVKHLFHHPEKS